MYDEGENDMYTKMYNEGELKFHGTTMFVVGVISGVVGAIGFEFFMLWIAGHI